MSFGTSRSFTIDPATSDDSSAPSVSSTLIIIYYTFFWKTIKDTDVFLMESIDVYSLFPCKTEGKFTLLLGNPCHPSDSYSSLDRYHLLI